MAYLMPSEFVTKMVDAGESTTRSITPLVFPICSERMQNLITIHRWRSYCYTKNHADHDRTCGISGRSRGRQSTCQLDSQREWNS